MWPAIIAYAKTQFDDAEEDYVDGLDKELQMSVPLLWYPSSNKIMSEAAELASLPRTELVLEPIAAAACVLDAITANSWNKSKFDLKRLAKGKLIQVVDLGGGTCDNVTCRVSKESANGATMGLEVVSQPSGGLCGSYFIDQEFLK